MDKIKLKQKFHIIMGLRISEKDSVTTESKVMNWLKKKLKDCPFGDLYVADVIEMK